MKDNAEYEVCQNFLQKTYSIVIKSSGRHGNVGDKIIPFLLPTWEEVLQVLLVFGVTTSTLSPVVHFLDLYVCLDLIDIVSVQEVHFTHSRNTILDDSTYGNFLLSFILWDLNHIDGICEVVNCLF